MKRVDYFNRPSTEERDNLKTQLSALDEEDEQAETVPDQIEKNNATILAYSKEDTILIYEQRAINEKFGSFDDLRRQLIPFMLIMLSN